MSVKFKISGRERKILLIAAAGAFLIFNYLVVWDWIGTALSKQKELGQLRAELQKRRAVVARTSEWEGEIRSLKTRYKLDGPKGEENSEWLPRLENLAKRSGLNVTNRRPLPEKRTAFGTESGVNYSIEGGQEALVKFLYALQRDPANPQVLLLQITPESPNVDKLRVEATILVTRYNL
ncbi:MAG: hypothetical protein JO317_03115 [Verrucomicrobiae bacterium]|nr:hypothetical protein [Verrucomicrobiae bacterium]